MRSASLDAARAFFLVERERERERERESESESESEREREKKREKRSASRFGLKQEGGLWLRDFGLAPSGRDREREREKECGAFLHHDNIVMLPKGDCAGRGHLLQAPFTCYKRKTRRTRNLKHVSETTLKSSWQHNKNFNKTP